MEADQAIPLARPQASVTAVEASVIVLQASVSGLQASLSGLQASLSGLQASVSGLQASVRKLQASMAAVEASTAAIQASITALQTSVEASLTTFRNDIRNDMQNRFEIWEVNAKARKAKNKNAQSQTPANRALHVAYVPIPKTVPGHPTFARTRVATMPAANIGDFLPTSTTNPLRSWKLPAHPNMTITRNRVLELEHWYNEDFGLPENATDEQAALCLYQWMRGDM